MTITQKEITSSEKKFKLVLKTIYKKFFLTDQDNVRFPSLCLASENAFLSYFTQKKPVKMTTLEKKKLVLKTTYKKLFLKYQDNARQYLLCVWPLRMHYWGIPSSDGIPYGLADFFLLRCRYRW